MSRPRHGDPGPEAEDERPAPVDLLQMWITGRDAAAARATSPEPGPDAETAPPEPAEETEVEVEPDVEPEVDPEPQSDTAASADDVTHPADVTDAPEPSTAAAGGWWPTQPTPVVGTTSPRPSGPGAGSDAHDVAATADPDAPEPSGDAAWWPYTESPTSEQVDDDPGPTRPDGSDGSDGASAAPSMLAGADQDGLHDDVESEWSAGDGPAASAAEPDPGPDSDQADVAGADPVQPVGPGDADDERAGGWASFGAAQTAEDVLDKLSSRAAWPTARTARPPADVGPREDDPVFEEPAPTAEAASEADPVFEESAPMADDPEPEPEADPEADPETAAEPEPGAAVEAGTAGPDLSATTHWSLDDFETYIKAQGGNELASWMGTHDAAVSPLGTGPTEESTAEQPELEPDSAAETETARETPVATTAEDPGEDPTPGAEDISEPLPFVWTPTVVPDLPADPARDQPTDQSDEPEGDAISAMSGAEDSWAQPDVEWDDEHDTATDLPAVPSEAQEALFGPAATVPHDRSDEPTDQTTAPGEPEEGRTDPDATQRFDALALDDPAGPVADTDETLPGVPAPEPVEPRTETAEAEPESLQPVPTPLEPQTEPPQAEDDHQEWFDDHGLRWVSGDGGYTWFSDDGQGWNAEIGEPIEVPTGQHAAPVEPATPVAPVELRAHGVPQAPSRQPAAPLFRDEVERSGEVQEPPPAPDDDAGDDVWPETSTGSIPAYRAPEPDPATQSMWPGEAPESLPDTGSTATAAEVEAETPPAGTHVGAHVGVSKETPPEAPTAEAPGDTPVQPGRDEIPPYVEYKPRGAYRPLLGLLFVVAALLAAGAIFWAITQGSQAAIGIAAGVTFFSIAFWWGLLSWTPTVVSLSGSVLEVARGSDGERFDLRSPRLMIDVDDDTGSRNWRTTITRPNGTELVIPASAVEPEEFARIVTHYRSEVRATPEGPVPGS